MKDQIVRLKLFAPVDFLEEEKYLEEMHKKGYKLIQVFTWFFYVFEKCEPEDVIYRLDFKNNKETDEYMKMAEDYNWEYVASDGGFVFFRKKVKASDTSSDLEFFTDNESRLEMVKTIVKKRLIPIGVFLLIAFLFTVFELFNYEDFKYISIYDNISLMAVYLSVLIHSTRKIRRMKRGEFEVEKNTNKFVMAVTILAVIYLLMPPLGSEKAKGIKKIDAKDYAMIHITDVESGEDYIVSKDDDKERLINIVFSDELKKEGKYRARDDIETKELFFIYLLDDSGVYKEMAEVLDNNVVVYDLKKYALDNNEKIDIIGINNIENDSLLLKKVLKHDGHIYVKTDVKSEGRIENLDVYFFESYVGLGNEVKNNEENNYIGSAYQIIDENTINAEVSEAWYIFEKEE